MGRTSADITIHRIDGTTFNVPITTEARRTFGLGQEDNIRLKWDDTTPYRARVGDWVNDELFGLFYVTEEQEPTVDSATGAYRHDIRFDRDYIGWKNVLHMLTYSDGGSIVRKETDWSLTDTLANHLKAVKDGLSALGYTMATSVVESGVDNSDSAVTISFAGTSVYDALNTIADAYRCEWWVTYNSDYSVRTIHMGKMELSGSAYPITLGDNAEDITPNKSDAETANRVYAFGSTRNIPDTYRKTLSFSVTDTATRTSDSRSATVFRDSSRVVRQDMLRLSQSLDFDLRLATPAYETNAGGQRYKAVFTDAMTIDRMVRYAAMGNLEYTVEFVRDDASESTELEGYAWELRIGSNIIGSGAAMFSNHERVLGRAVKTVSVPVDESLVLQPGSTEARFSVWTNDGILVLSTASANSGVLSLKANGYGIDCPLTFNGNTYTVTFNPLAEEITTSVFNWFAFSGQVPSGFAVGSKYTLGVSEDESDPGLLPLKIPVSFYTDDMGSLSVMKMIGERRLMLPTSTPGYVERGDTSVNRVVEKVVVFDNEYPKLCLQITEIEEGAYTDNTEWSDGSRSYGTLPKYTIKVKRVASGGSLADFPFKSDYLTTEPLKAVFMTRDEAVGHGAVPPSTAGFKLSGMTFGLNFSAAEQTYTIAFNEDYGAKLPNGILKPQVGDCLLLTGWNVAALTSLGLVSASENRLLSLANDYIDALQAPSHTYRCRMMSDSMMEDGLLEAGEKVVITRDDISDSTRVIGFEYKLDIPEDTPVYECGETETYSRLRALEKALNARSQSVSSSSGTLTSSYSQSGSESQPSQPASLTGKLYWKGGAVTDFEGDDFDGSEDKTLTVPTDISHLSGSGTLPRIGKVKETLEDGTKVIDLLDDSGTKLLPSANIDWFIVEEVTENEVTTYRLKLNPKYVGMYAEGWVSAGGVSEQGGGGGGTGYLRDLLDVNASMSPTQGQALVWDDALGKWTSGDVSVDLTPYERIANRVTTVSSSSNHTQYPTAKAVYDIVNTMLSSAMRFQGVTSTALVDGSTTNPVIVDGASYTATRGDVVVRSDVGLEYLWTGAKWQQLGDETSYAKKTVTITGSGYLTGGGNLEAAREIDIAAEVKTKIDNGATAFSYFTDGAANEAIKLKTPRTIWGQSFDGSGNVVGDLYLGSNTATTNSNSDVLRFNGYIDKTYITGPSLRSINVESYGRARLAVFQHNSGDYTGEYEVLSILPNGNVGFGTNTPAYKADIVGDSRTSGKVYIGTSGGYLEVVNVGTTASPVYALKSSLPFYSDSWVSAGGVSPTGSGGGITGYLKDLLDVNGSMIPVDGQALVWDSSLGDNGRWTSKNVSVDLTPFERTSNKATTISASSTDGQYPSARAVYNAMGNYLPLTGASLSSPLRLSKDLGGNLADWTAYQHKGPFEVGRSSNSMCLAMGVTDDNYGYIQSKGFGITSGGDLVLQPYGGGLYASMNRYKIWHEGNDGAGSGLDADLLDGKHLSEILASNVASATKLQTAKTIWGQPFDGTGDVSGDIKASDRIVFYEDSSTQASIGRGGVYSTGISDKDLWFFNNAGNCVFWGTNVGVGTDNPSYKLDVNGNIKGNAIQSDVITGNLTDMFSDGTYSRPWYGLSCYANDPLVTLAGYYGIGFRVASGDVRLDRSGNVGIGTTAPAYKLDVAGVIRAEKLIGTATGITETSLEDEEFTCQATPVQGIADGYRIDRIKGNTIVSDGELINNSAEAIETTGFNQWDEEWGYGYWNVGSGIRSYYSEEYCTENFIPVIAGKTYFIKNTAGNYVLYYDKNKNLIGQDLYNFTFTTPSECAFVHVNFGAFPGTYNHDICINLSDPDRNGEYEPYWSAKTALGLSSIKVKDSNGNILEFNGLASAGDVYDEIVGGKLIKRIGSYTLTGSESWTANGSNMYRSNFTIPRKLSSTYWGTQGNLISSRLTAATNSAVYNGAVTSAVCFTDSTSAGYIGISKDVYDNIASYVGTTIYYELATPVTYELVSSVPLSGRIDGNGTMRVISDGPVAPFRGDITYGCNPGQMGADASSVKSYLDTMLEIKVVDGQPVLHSKLPLYSDSWISAGGLSDTGEEDGATYLKNLLDVDDNLVESAGYGLVYDGTQWTSEQIVPASRKINGVTLTSDVSLSLGSLSNVSVTGATNGQQLIYNGSEWIAGVPAGAKFFHGTCSTSSSSNTKVVDCPSFTSSDLVAGTAIAIVMQNRSDTTSTVTINVNGTGANTLLAGFANRKAWSAQELILAVYDGSGVWDMLPTWYYTYYYGGGGSGGGGGTGSTVVVTPRLSSGMRIATITVDGSATDLFAPSVSVSQTQGSTGGTQIASINSTAIYAPAVTVTQVQTSGVEVARIKVGSANPVSIYAPSGSSGSSGVQTVVGRTGDVTTDQIATALTNAGYKLTDTVQDLSGYLPLTAGSSKALTNTLYTRGLLPTANASYDLGSLSAAYNNTYTKRVYLADGVYIEYDSTNRCVYVHGAGIATDSFVSAGGVSTTSN